MMLRLGNKQCITYRLRYNDHTSNYMLFDAVYIYYIFFLLFYITSIYTCTIKSVILQFVYIGIKTHIQYCFWNVYKLYKSCDYINIHSIANDCSSK